MFSISMKNGCLVTIVFNFVIKFAWTFFFLSLHAWDNCDLLVTRTLVHRYLLTQYQCFELWLIVSTQLHECIRIFIDFTTSLSINSNWFSTSLDKKVKSLYILEFISLGVFCPFMQKCSYVWWGLWSQIIKL